MTDRSESPGELSEETSNFEALKLFEFFRLRCKNHKSDNKLLTEDSNVTYLVPTKRSGHRAVCDDENLWLWGGYCPIGYSDDPEDREILNPMLPQLFRFNLATEKWCLLKTAGEAPNNTVASHCAILSNNLLIVIGGTGFPFGMNLSNSLHTCNLKTLVWKKHDLTGQIPIPLYGSSLILKDNYLYLLFGTTSHQYCSNVYRIDIKTLESVKLFDSLGLIDNLSYIEYTKIQQDYPDDFLVGRYRQEVALYESKIYVFGGGKFDGNCFTLTKLPCFNLNTNKWEFIETLPDENSKDFPESRKFHSCFAIEDFIYIFGGLKCDINMDMHSIVQNYVWRLNMIDLRWEKLDIKTPVNTYFHAACEINGQVFIHGGIKENENPRNLPTRINHLYSIHLKIPKLSDLAWRASLKNISSLTNINNQVLINAGFPVNFVKKIN